MTILVNEVNRRQLLRGAVALFATLGCSQAGFAAAIGKQSARALVNGLVGQILEAISAGGQGADREGRLMAAIESQTDLSLLARMTMGRYWRRATVRQREAFVDVFGRYLLSNFTSRLRHYAGRRSRGSARAFQDHGHQERRQERCRGSIARNPAEGRHRSPWIGACAPRGIGCSSSISWWRGSACWLPSGRSSAASLSVSGSTV